MKRFLRPLTILISLAVILAFFGLMQYLVRPATEDAALSSIRIFHTREADVMEVIGFGSSHMWKGLNPMVMYEAYGIGAYNYGCNWQSINTTYLFLQDALKTQSPKVVLIETYCVNEVLSDTDMDGQIYYTRALPWSSAKINYLRGCFSTVSGTTAATDQTLAATATDGSQTTATASRSYAARMVDYLFPLLAFHDNWSEIRLATFFQSSVDASDFVNLMGYCRQDSVMAVDIPAQSMATQLPLDDASVEVLDAIVALCQAHDIAIVFYTAPYQGSYHYRDAMTAYAAANDCDYLNLFEVLHVMEIDQATDFADKSHLNDAGTTKLSRYLAEYLVEHYDLTDLREVEGNMWATALANLAQ